MAMDPTEITKVIDGVYKNILENFNPASREMIATGKAYLKALHGASAASSLYLESLLKVSKQAEESSLGCSGDIGSSLMEVTEVFKEIHAQQLSALKAFYVDFLVPLEANLERDTRVIQNEQKKFLVSHKRRIELFVKASTVAKKLKKKGRKSTCSTAIDKEIKVMQELEEEKAKLELFCENSLNSALTEERRRYGFILERQASHAKHCLSVYSKGNSLLSQRLEEWMKVSKTREVLPQPMQDKLINRIQKGSEDDCIYCTPRGHGVDDSHSNFSTQLRKSKSMEGCEMLDCVEEVDERIGALSRAKSDMSLLMTAPTASEFDGKSGHSPNSERERAGCGPVSLAVSTESPTGGVAKALYAYLSSGDNQLSFLEGDIIICMGDRNKGWQFGENLRTQKTGWFPVAYTQAPGSPGISPATSCDSEGPAPPSLPPPGHGGHQHSQPMRAIMDRSQLAKNGNSPGLISTSTSTQTPMTTVIGRASDSLTSSNDSGFSTDLMHKGIPPQPEVDYSEDEPQLSSSGTMRSGDKWLMDKYHKSESARIQHTVGTRRRAMSFANVTHGPGVVGLGKDGGRGRPTIRGPRVVRHQSTSSSREGGPLAKLLHRTKSLIWKKGISPPRSKAPLPQKGTFGFDSTSAIGSCEFEDLWGSHTSLVELDSGSHSPPSAVVKETERTSPPAKRTEPIKNSHHNHHEPIKNGHRAEPIKTTHTHQHSQTDEPPHAPPPLPPLPPPLPAWRTSNRSSENKENKRIKEIYGGGNLSRSVKSGGMTPSGGSVRRSESEKVRNLNPHHRGSDKMRNLNPQDRVLRVESFSGSEAPIVPRNNMRMRHRGQQPQFSSRASIQSQNLEEEEDEEFIDDGSSSIFIDAEIQEACQPTPPPSIRVGSSTVAANQSKQRRGNMGNSKGSLRLLASRIKSSQSVRVTPNGADCRRGSPDPSESKMSSIMDDGQRRRARRFKGSIRSEVHTLELIGSESDGGGCGFQLPLFEYGTQIQKRLYYPERNSKLDQKSERTGNLCGPWYDLWGVDPSVTQISHVN